MKGEYGQSAQGNFKVVDTIAVPHPYMVTAAHVCHASDHFGGHLSKECILDGEKKRIVCGICKGALTFEQHESALLIECPKGVPLGGNEELADYLKSIVSKAEENGYCGFAFKDGA